MPTTTTVHPDRSHAAALQRRQITDTILLCVIICSLGAPPAHVKAQSLDESPIDLRWNLQEGDRYELHLQQVTVTETNRGENAAQIRIEMTIELLWRVQKVDDHGDAELEMSFSRLSASTRSAAGKQASYDSTSDENTPPEMWELAETVRPLLDTHFTLKVSPRGEILAVASTGLTANTFPGKTHWERVLSTDGLNRMLCQSLGIMPNQSLHQGEQWTQTRQLQSDVGNVSVNTTYTYVGLQKQKDQSRHRIDIEAEATQQTAPGSDPFGIRKTAEPVKQRGVLWFEPQGGYVAASSLEQTMQAEIPLGQQAVKVKITNTIDFQMARKTAR